MLLHTLIIMSVMAMPGADITHSDPHHDHAAQLQYNNGQQWQTDAPLRQAMDDLNDAITERLHAAHSSDLTAEQYQPLAALIDERVAYIVRNCSLPAAADAELHKLIGMLVAASETMRSSDNPRAGFMAAVRALNSYGEYFAHPGWIAPKH